LIDQLIGVNLLNSSCCGSHEAINTFAGGFSGRLPSQRIMKRVLDSFKAVKIVSCVAAGNSPTLTPLPRLMKMNPFEPPSSMNFAISYKANENFYS